MAANPLQRAFGYSLPGGFILTSVACNLFTAVTHPVLLVSRFSSFQEKVFSNVWAIGGVICARDTPPALLTILDESRGVILDVGPGAGHQLYRFRNPGNIEAIYGVEPGISMHNRLRQRAQQAGLGDKYKIVPCEARIEDLAPAFESYGILKQKARGHDSPFDEIVCIRVLCGVANQQDVINGLYSLLKPGGRMVVCEHVANSGKPAGGGTAVGRFLQKAYMRLGWSFWIGGCDLIRDTTACLEKAAEQDGGWAKVELENSDPWSCLPHITGVLVKKK